MWVIRSRRRFGLWKSTPKASTSPILKLKGSAPIITASRDISQFQLPLHNNSRVPYHQPSIPTRPLPPGDSHSLNPLFEPPPNPKMAGGGPGGVFDGALGSPVPSKEESLWLSIVLRVAAVLFAGILSYILFRVCTGAWAQYKNNPSAKLFSLRPTNRYQRVPTIRIQDEDEDEGYHDAESFEIQRTPNLSKPLPDRPLPDKPLPPPPGAV